MVHRGRAWKPLYILPRPPIYHERCPCKKQKNHFAPTQTMPPAYLNYTTLGLKGFEVFPHKLAYDGVLVDEILGPICEKLGYTFFVRSSELWLVCRLRLRTPGRTDIRLSLVERTDSLRSNQLESMAARWVDRLGRICHQSFPRGENVIRLDQP